MRPKKNSNRFETLRLVCPVRYRSDLAKIAISVASKQAMLDVSIIPLIFGPKIIRKNKQNNSQLRLFMIKILKDLQVLQE
jgi:hypothetical protein